MVDYRIEKDSIGDIKVNNNVMWGAQTQRSIQNFDISQRKFPIQFIKSHVELKRACAIANKELGMLDEQIADAIIKASEDILERNLYLDMFPLDIFQTGSGTQTNMNVNEVLSNIAIKNLGGTLGSKSPVHPNDHVNLGQSSNDTIPTSMHIASIQSIIKSLIPSIDQLINGLTEKQNEFSEIIKIGRTHLQDAVPLTIGQEFSGYIAQLLDAKLNISQTKDFLKKLAIGGTAVGTGINAHPKLSLKVCEILSKRIGVDFNHTGNKFSLIASKDLFVMLSGSLRTLAITLMKISNDIRWLASGPRAGLGELILPSNEPGSSIMPGKINPTQNEMLIQVAAQVIGNDTAVSTGAQWSYLELNLMKPVIISNILESIEILSKGMISFNKNAIQGLQVNKERISNLLEQSLMLATALTPHLGYDKAAEIAKIAYKNNQTIREVLEQGKYLNKEDIDKFLNFQNMI